MRKIWNFMRFNIFALINEVWNFVGSFPFANIILLILIWTDRFAYWLIGRRLWRKFGGLMLFTFIFWQLAVAKSSFYEIEFEKTFILIPKESRWSENREKPKLFPIFFESISNFCFKILILIPEVSAFSGFFDQAQNKKSRSWIPGIDPILKKYLDTFQGQLLITQGKSKSENPEAKLRILDNVSNTQI